MAETKLRVAGTPASNSEPTKTDKPERVRLNKVLPTTRVSYAKQLDILRAVAAASGPSNKAVTTEEIASIVKMVASTVMLTNPFFLDAGLIVKAADQKGNEPSRFHPSAAVVSFKRAYEWDSQKAAMKLYPVMVRTWFAEALLPQLNFGPTPVSEAIQVLADQAHAGTQHRPQLDLLLQYLESGGVIAREGDFIRLAAAPPVVAENEPDTPSPTTQHAPSPPSPSPMVSTGFTQPTQGIVNFHVDFKVDMAEFDGWSADRIAAFFNGIAAVLAAKSAVEKSAG